MFNPLSDVDVVEVEEVVLTEEEPYLKNADKLSDGHAWRVNEVRGEKHG